MGKSECGSGKRKKVGRWEGEKVGENAEVGIWERVGSKIKGQRMEGRKVSGADAPADSS
jgi:hypothetical protein